MSLLSGKNSHFLILLAAMVMLVVCISGILSMMHETHCVVLFCSDGHHLEMIHSISHSVTPQAAMVLPMLFFMALSIILLALFSTFRLDAVPLIAYYRHIRLQYGTSQSFSSLVPLFARGILHPKTF